MAAYAAIALNTSIVYWNQYVILAKRRLWLPDGGLCKPKHVGAAFIILIVLKV
jgi:hypothetical protein